MRLDLYCPSSWRLSRARDLPLMHLFLACAIIGGGEAHRGALGCLDELRDILDLLQGVPEIYLRCVHHHGVSPLSDEA